MYMYQGKDSFEGNLSKGLREKARKVFTLKFN